MQVSKRLRELLSLPLCAAQVEQIWWVSSFVRNRDSIGSRSVVLNETRSSHRPGWQRRYEGKASRSQILNVDVQSPDCYGSLCCAVRDRWHWDVAGFEDIFT